MGMVKVSMETDTGTERAASTRCESEEQSHDVHGLAWAISAALAGLGRNDSLEVLARAAETIVESHMPSGMDEKQTSAAECFADACVTYYAFCEEDERQKHREIMQRLTDANKQGGN